MLVNSLIISKLLYLLPVFGGTQRKYLDKMQVTLNNSARFVTGLGNRTNKRTLMTACDWLDIDELILYHSLSQLWRVVHLQVPLHIFRKLTILNEYRIVTSVPRLQNTESSFRWKMTVEWNNLSVSIRCLQSLPAFKKQVKKWILSRRAPNPGTIHLD